MLSICCCNFSLPLSFRQRPSAFFASLNASSAVQLVSLHRAGTTGNHRDQFLLSVGGRALQHQQARAIVGQPAGKVDAVGPEVNVVFAGQVAFTPIAILDPPRLGHPYHRGRRHPRTVEAQMNQRIGHLADDVVILHGFKTCRTTSLAN